MRVIVCGGRDYANQPVAWAALDAFHRHNAISCVIEGGARGADRIARAWANARGVKVETFPADWALLGLRAGPCRNQEMIDVGKPEAVIAFPGGSGTADMVRRAHAAGGIPVYHVSDAGELSAMMRGAPVRMTLPPGF